MSGTALRSADTPTAVAPAGIAIEPQSRSQPEGATWLLSATLLLAALASWFVGLPTVDPDKLTDLGIVAILPVPIWIALALVVTSFTLALRPVAVEGPLPWLALAVLVLVLHLTPAIAYETLRYSWAWKHIGIIDFIARHHALAPQARFLSVYHNWPGFFATYALLDDAFRLGPLGVAEIARYYPTILNLLYLAVLPWIVRRLTDDPRLVWTATAFFLIGNWVGQDYFSPQGTAYLFYLGLLALALGPLARVPQLPAPSATGLRGRMQRLLHRASAAQPVAPPAGNGVWVISMIAALVAIAAITVTHQLTPLLTIGALTALTILGRLPILYCLFAIAAEALWIFYFADPFVSKILAEIVGQVPSLNADTLSKMARFELLSPGQRWVSIASRGLTATIAAMALLGGARRLALGRVDGVAALLTMVPLPLLFATSYGGEIIFRLYFYALPFLAFFAGAVFYPSAQRGRSPWINCVLWLICPVLILGFLLANNGKDRQYRFSPLEVMAANWLYSTAPPQSLLVEGSRNYPSQFRNYENFNYVPISEETPAATAEILADPVAVLGRWLGEAPNGGYIIFTHSQIASLEDLGVVQAGALETVIAKLIASPRFDLVYSNRDAKIFRLSRAAADFSRWME